MNKKLFGTLLLGSLVVGGTFVSCQDYDDDIKNLQEQINALKPLESQLNDLKGQLGISATECQSKIDAAISALTNGDVKKALDAAANAKGLAEAAQRAAESAGLSEEDAKQINWVKENAQKLVTVESLNAKADEILRSIADKKYATVADVLDKYDDLKKAAADILPQRLSSLVFAPTKYINGIEAIEFANLKYQGWTDTKQDAPNEVDKDKKAVTYSIANDGAEAEYFVSPENTALKSIKELSFLSNIATNTRAVEKAVISTDLQKATIKDGKLVLKLKKDNTADWGTPSTSTASKETFPIVALKAVLADEVLSGAEKEAKEEVAVFSDWARVVETTSTPIIDNKTIEAANRHKNHATWDYATSRSKAEVADHFWNYTTVYPNATRDGSTQAAPNTTDAQKYIAKTATYKEPVDLNTLTQICTWSSDAAGVKTLNDDPKAASELGLTIEYSLVDYWYKNQGTTNDVTNQKSFGVIEEGHMLYATSQNGLKNNADAVGRTPLVCAVLKYGEKIVDVVYFKIQWANVVIPATYKVADAATLDPVAFTCAPNLYDQWIGEKYMNSLYASMNDNAGLSRSDFHKTFSKVLTKTPLEDNDYDWSAMKGKLANGTKLNAAKTVQGDLYFGKVTDAAKAAVQKGDMKGFKVIGYVSDLYDAEELTQTHNIQIVADAKSINPTEEKDFETDAFFAYKTADGKSYVIVPVTIVVKAGQFAYAYNYLEPQWEKNGGKLETANSKKARPVNPTLYSDPVKGNKTYKTTQLVGDFTYGYMKDSKNPTDIAALVNYTAYKSNAKAAATDIVFDKARLNELPAVNVDTKKAAKWTLNDAAVTLDGVVYAPGKVLYENGVVAAVINANEVYLIDAKEAQSLGAVSAKDYPTSAARTLVGKSVPVKVVAKNCYAVDFDKYVVRFITPLEIALVEGGIELKDVLNEGDAKSVTLSDKYSLKEAFGSRTEIILFGDKKNTTLIDWYEIKNIKVELGNAIINVDKDGKIVTDETKFSKLADLKNASDKQLYVLKTVKNTGTEKEPVWVETDKADEISGLKFHNNSGQAITEDLVIKLPIGMDTKWQKGMSAHINVTVHPNL